MEGKETELQTKIKELQSSIAELEEILSGQQDQIIVSQEREKELLSEIKQLEQALASTRKFHADRIREQKGNNSDILKNAKITPF